MDGVRHYMRGEGANQKHWDPSHRVPWNRVRKVWEQHWDDDKAIKLEKSPPNLLRAEALQEVFRPSYFLVMMGDPYAFSEGCSRRDNRYDLTDCALLWLKCTRQQFSNLESLDNTHFLTYEALTSDTDTELKRIRNFMPELADVTLQPPEVQSVLGRNQRRVWNINRLKAARLSAEDVETINDTLRRAESVLTRSGYPLRNPSRQTSWRRWWLLFHVYLSRICRVLCSVGLLPERVLGWLEKRIIELSEKCTA